LAAELVAFGDISIDVAVRIPHLPLPDEKLWVEVAGEYPGGMGANVAAAFAALGGRAALAASVGDDDRGRRALEDLSARGIDLSAVAHLDGPTFWTLALLAAEGEKTLLQFSTPALFVPWGSIDWTLLDGAAFAHTIADEGEDNLRLIEEAGHRGVRVSIDIEPVSMSTSLRDRILGAVEVVFTTPSGLQAMDGPVDSADGARWLLERGPRVAAITLGRDGCFVADAEGREAQIPGHKVEVRDTTGAGDCYAGAFLFGLCRGRDPVEAGRVANLMAALSTTALGSRGNLATLDELAVHPEMAAVDLRTWHQ
jgi:ribokinase